MVSVGLETTGGGTVAPVALLASLSPSESAPPTRAGACGRVIGDVLEIVAIGCPCCGYKVIDGLASNLTAGLAL